MSKKKFNINTIITIWRSVSRKLLSVYVRVLFKAFNVLVIRRTPYPKIGLMLISLMPVTSMTTEQKHLSLTLLNKVLGRTKTNIANRLINSIVTEINDGKKGDQNLSEKGEKKKFRVFPSDVFKPIGHTALIDMYLEAEDACLIPKLTNIILGESSAYANPILVELLKKECKEDLCLSAGLKLLSPSAAIVEDIFKVKTLNGVYMSIQELGSKLDRIKKSPRLGKQYLTEEQILEAETGLEIMGFDKTRWICGLHIRRSAKPNSYDIFSNGLRNSSAPEDYIEAINLISREGGQIIRVGVNETDSLYYLKLKNYIEISDKNNKNGLLDTYVFSKCSFFVGCQSGPATAARMFHKPTLFANWSSVKDLTLGFGNTGSYLLLKNYNWIINNSPLLLAQRFDDPCGESWSSEILNSHGIAVNDNTPTQIYGAIKQLIEEVIYSLPAKIHPMQIEFDELLENYTLSPIRLSLSSPA